MNDTKKIISIKDFISGALAGVSQTLIGQPFDIVKVRMQTSNQVGIGTFDIVKSIMKKEGIKGFYKGTVSPLIGNAFSISTLFGANEICKNSILKHKMKTSNTLNLELTTLEIHICGAIAGMCNAIWISPTELFRIKMQIQATGEPRYTGSIDCAVKTVKQFGLRGFFQGLNSTLVREGVGVSVYLGYYETRIKKLEKKYKSRQNIPKYLVLWNGSLSGLLYWFVIFPVDVVKSCIQSEAYPNKVYKTFLRTLLILYSQKGYKCFFNGIMPCLTRAPFVNAGVFLTYELSKNFLIHF